MKYKIYKEDNITYKETYKGIFRLYNGCWVLEEPSSNKWKSKLSKPKKDKLPSHYTFDKREKRKEQTLRRYT